MVYLIIFGSLFAAVAVSFFLTKLIWTIPFVRKFHEIASYNEIIKKSSDDQIDEHPPLVDFTNFDDAYLFEAVKLLVKHEPSRAAAIVVTLEPRLSQLRKDMWELGGDAWSAFHEAAEDWAQHMMTVAPVSWIMDLWQKADHRRDQIWLFELIFRNKAKPIYLHEDESPNGIFIECEQKIFLLRASDKEYNTMKCISSILLTKKIFGWIRNPDDIVNSNPVRPIDMILATEEARKWTKDANDIINTFLDQEAKGIIPRRGSDLESVLGQGPKTIGALIDRKVGLIAPEETERQIPAP